MAYEKYPYLDDVDYVKINVIGDGSCFYRAIYTAAKFYPIADPEIAPNLMDEFIGVENLLSNLLAAFQIDRILNEDDAVRAIRNNISAALKGVGNPGFVATCTAHYLAVLNRLREAYQGNPAYYHEIIREAAIEFSKIFRNDLIRDHLVGTGEQAQSYLTNYNNRYNELKAEYAQQLQISPNSVNKEGIKTILEADEGYSQEVIIALQQDPDEYFLREIADIIKNITTYASESDIGLIQTILAANNIIIRTTTLETINKAQTFPIIIDRKPILLVDRVGQIHYMALIPFEVFKAEIARNPRLATSVSTYGRPAKPIKYSRCTYKKRKQRGLRGGSRRLKRRGRK